MDDATAQAASRHAEAQIEELPEPARTIAKLLLEAGRWAVSGALAGVDVRVVAVDGRVFEASFGAPTSPYQSDPRETHAAPEARQ
jgi:hypothetical protein